MIELLQQERPVHRAQRTRHLPCDEILDPLTGELISIKEKEQIVRLHRRLEEIALELLSTCHQIRTALDFSSKAESRTDPLERLPIGYNGEGWAR